MMSAVLGVVVVGLVSGATAAPASQEKAAYEVTIPGLGTVRGITANNSESIAFFGGGWRCVIRHDHDANTKRPPSHSEKEIQLRAYTHSVSSVVRYTNTVVGF